MIAANLMVVFPLVTTPWWIWAMVILAMLAVLGVSILVSMHSGGSENPPAQTPEHKPDQQAGPPGPAPDGQAKAGEPEVSTAPRTAGVGAGHIEVYLPEGDMHVAPQHVELPPPDLFPKEIDREIENGLQPAVPAAASGQDDLKRVRGITPSTAAVLHQAGIHTYAQLASANTGDLEKILRSAGMRTVDPRSWPEQAHLAAVGDWDALGQLQERLKENK